MASSIKKATTEFLLLYIFVISSAICFLSLNMFSVDGIDVMVVLKLGGSILMLQFYLFLFSFHGTRIMEANFQVASEISQIDWFDMRSMRLRKYLIIIMCMGQRRIGIKIGGFCFVTLATYSEIVNSIVSYFSVLRGLLIDKK